MRPKVVLADIILFSLDTAGKLSRRAMSVREQILKGAEEHRIAEVERKKDKLRLRLGVVLLENRKRHMERSLARSPSASEEWLENRGREMRQAHLTWRDQVDEKKCGQCDGGGT